MMEDCRCLHLRQILKRIYRARKMNKARKGRYNEKMAMVMEEWTTANIDFLGRQPPKPNF